jgi:hypothetical protein
MHCHPDGRRRTQAPPYPSPGRSPCMFLFYTCMHEKVFSLPLSRRTQAPPYPSPGRSPYVRASALSGPDTDRRIYSMQITWCLNVFRLVHM